MKLKPAGILIALCGFRRDRPCQCRLKQGDNLGKLSRELLDSPVRWNEVSRYNQLKNSNLITSGETLRMQLAWLKNVPADARIESLTGAAMLNLSGFNSPVHLGRRLAESQQLEERC